MAQPSAFAKAHASAFALLLLLASVPTAATDAGDDTLTVCTVLEMGFCMLGNGVTDSSAVTSDSQLRGFHVDLRRTVLAHRNYTIRLLDSYGELQVRTRAGECDVGWAEFFHTTERKRCDSTCPALNSETAAGTVASWEPYRCCADYSINVLPLSIVALHHGTQRSFFEAFINAVVDPFFINLLSFAFLWLVFFAHCAWLAERRGNEAEFPTSYLGGIDDAIWWAIVTFTTVGYGDKAPKSAIGRIVAMVWMILGITLSAILTGHLAGSFLSQGSALPSAPRVMQGKRVCGYPSTFSHWYVPSSISFTPIVGQSVADCGTMMQAGSVDVILMEQPTIQYWMRNDPWAQGQKIRVSTPINDGNPIPQGVLYPKNSPLREELDMQILLGHESPQLQAIWHAWFSASDAPTAESDLQLEVVVPALALLGTYALLLLLNECGQRLCKRRTSTDGQRQAKVAPPAADPNFGAGETWGAPANVYASPYAGPY